MGKISSGMLSRFPPRLSKITTHVSAVQRTLEVLPTHCNGCNVAAFCVVELQAVSLYGHNQQYVIQVEHNKNYLSKVITLQLTCGCQYAHTCGSGLVVTQLVV